MSASLANFFESVGGVCSVFDCGGGFPPPPPPPPPTCESCTKERQEEIAECQGDASDGVAECRDDLRENFALPNCRKGIGLDGARPPRTQYCPKKGSGLLELDLRYYGICFDATIPACADRWMDGDNSISTGSSVGISVDLGPFGGEAGETFSVNFPRRIGLGELCTQVGTQVAMSCPGKAKSCDELCGNPLIVDPDHSLDFGTMTVGRLVKQGSADLDSISAFATAETEEYRFVQPRELRDSYPLGDARAAVLGLNSFASFTKEASLDEAEAAYLLNAVGVASELLVDLISYLGEVHEMGGAIGEDGQFLSLRPDAARRGITAIEARLFEDLEKGMNARALSLLRQRWPGLSLLQRSLEKTPARTGQ